MILLAQKWSKQTILARNWPKTALFKPIFDHLMVENVQKIKRRVKAGPRYQTNRILGYFGDANTVKGGGTSPKEQFTFFQNQ